MLSTDTKLLEDSPARARVASYGAIVDELVIVLFATGERVEQALGKNVHLVRPQAETKVEVLYEGYREILRQSKRSGFEIVSSQDPFFIGLAGLLASRIVGAKFQVQLHTDCFSSRYYFESPRRFLEMLIARVCISAADCVRVVSHRIATHVKSMTSRPVAVVPIRVMKPAHISERPFGMRSDRFTVLSVARFTEEKQLGILIDAVSEVENIDLVLLGEGRLQEVLERHIKSRGVSERVRIIPWQKPDAFYSHANAFVSVSKYEGYGLAIMEAALAGLPIVATDVGVVGYELKPGDDVLMVQSTSNSVAEAFTKLKSDASLREKLGVSARKKAEQQLVTEEGYLQKYRDALMASVA